MVTLKVFTSKVEIVTDDDLLLKKCKKLLNIYYRDFQNPSQFLSVYLGRGNFFPIGYLPQFLKKAQKKNIQIKKEESQNSVTQHQKMKFRTDFEYRDHQKRCLDSTENNNVGIVSSPTASGKTLMIAATIAQKCTTTLVIVPNTTIRDEMTANFKEWFGSSSTASVPAIKPWAPGLDKLNNEKHESFNLDDEEDSEEFNQDDEFAFLLKKRKKEKKKENSFEKAKRKNLEAIQRKIDKGLWYKPITIICWNSIKGLSLDYIKKIGCIIIDECHTSSIGDIRDLMWKAENAVYRYGFSATPWRDQSHLYALMQSAIGSEIIFDYSPEDAMDDGVIATPNLNIIQAEFPDVFLKNARNYRKIVDNGVVRNKGRNQQIVKKAVELYDNNNCVFIAIDEVGHWEGKTVTVKGKDGMPDERKRDEDTSYCLKELFEKAETPVIFISGEDSNKEKNEKIEILRNSNSGFIVVGTMAIGIGTDIPTINKVILASTGESSTRYIQRIGRGMRANGDENKTLEVFDFMDRWNPKAKKFSIERIKTFVKYYKGCKVFGF